MIQKSLIAKKEGFTAKQAIDFLESKGYTVTAPKSESKVVTKVDVISFFYKSLADKVSKGTILSGQINDKGDNQALTTFHERAKLCGMSPYEANRYLVDSLKLVFLYYHELGLTTDITSLWFVLNKGSWVFSKAELIHIKKIAEFEESDQVTSWKEEMYESTEGIEKYLTKKIFDI